MNSSTYPMLPMPNIFKSNQDLYFKCHREILDFCVTPSYSHGFKVILKRNVSCYKKGQKGIVRPFDALQIEQLIKEYHKELDLQNGFGLPNTNATYDFHPIVIIDGKKFISIWHTHVTQFDFERDCEQLKLEFE